jgi:hypothetical protein
MSKTERARHIRDLVLAKARLSLKASLALDGARFVTKERWRAEIRRTRIALAAMGEVHATKLTVSVDGRRVAVMAWTRDMFRLVKYACGQWESLYFDLPPYRNSAERWVDACSGPAADRSVLALMQTATPRRTVEAVPVE